MFGRRIRHLHRYREIAVAFSRNGFDFIVKELGLHEIVSLPKRLLFKNDVIQTKTTGEGVRLFLEELGPTFVKMGQIASTRSDLIPPDIIQELEKLQDRVSTFSFEDVKRIIEQELEIPLEQVFHEIHEQPLGAASIGQVHYAVLRSGERVAVKVQRPNVEKMIKTDLEILHHLAVIAEHRLEWAATYKIKDIVEEFSKALLAELDYTLEGRNADRIAKQFKADQTICIPAVYWDYTTKKVLTMEYIEGIKLNEQSLLNEKGYNKGLLAERVANGIFYQILIEGFFHGDPHPGNVAVLPGDKIVFMDFGMVGRLTPAMKNHFATIVIAMMRQSTGGVIKGLIRMGIVPDEVNMQQLHLDVDELRDKYYDVPLSQVSLGEAINDLFCIAHEHHIVIPADLTLLGKTLLTVEGIIEKLDPNLSIIHIAEPYGRQLLKERYNPKNIAQNISNDLGEYGEMLISLPKQVKELTELMKKGKIPVEISVPTVELFLTKLDRISNRLSFSIILLSFSIIMVGLIVGSAIGGQSTLLWNIPAIEIGFVVALLMLIGLLYSIYRTGRF